MQPSAAGHGRFITFEGGEGAGKSTQVARLAGALRSEGLDVLTTREPGGCPGAEQIRELLIHGATGRWEPLTETLLHFAARHQHWCETIAPALAEGRWVISDRFADSTLAYQSYGQGVARSDVARLYELILGDFMPDLTILLDVSVRCGARRVAQRGGADHRYKSMGLEFHRRVRHGFQRIHMENRERIVLIDGSMPLDDIHSLIVEHVRRRLRE